MISRRFRSLTECERDVPMLRNIGKRKQHWVWGATLVRRNIYVSAAPFQPHHSRCVAAMAIADTQAQRSSHMSSMHQPLNTVLRIIVSLSSNDPNTRCTGIQANRRARPVKTDYPWGCADGLRPPSRSIAVSRRFPLLRAMSPAWPTPHPR